MQKAMNHESSSQDQADFQPAESGYASCLPSLPAGYTAQPCSEFSGQGGRLLYEFNRVYKPIERLLDRVMTPLAELDEDLSFWAVRWDRRHESGDELPAGRWMTYGQARRLANPPRSLNQFLERRERVPALLHAQDLIGETVNGSTTLQANAPQGDAWATGA